MAELREAKKRIRLLEQEHEVLRRAATSPSRRATVQALAHRWPVSEPLGVV